MSLQKAKDYLSERGFADRVIEPDASSATVAEAAAALGCEPGEIAKTMSFMTPEGPVLILTEGTAFIDNRKFKRTFRAKAKMIPFDDVETIVGHAPGGVCPFGINDGITVCLDVTLKKYEIVYPACGNDHSAVRLTPEELEKCSGSVAWVDVCKEEK